MKFIYSCLALLLFSQILVAKEFDVTKYGAIGNGEFLNTESINQAIKDCHASGGGTVRFPSGIFLSGSIQMLSNVTIDLDAGAKILASPNLEDYGDLGIKSEGRSTSFIWAKDATNISIIGRGTIDGNDMAFFDEGVTEPEWEVDYSVIRQGSDFKVRLPDGPLKTKDRPGMLMTFIECENMLFEGITVQKAPNWNIHLACCKYVDFTNVKVLNSLLVPNSDGLDISQSQHVHISGCTLIAGDDGIAISPCADGFCDGEARDITVTNCTIESRSAAIRLGWAKSRISNCVFQNLMLNSNRGIWINGRLGETIENIIFSDLIINTRLHSGWWGKAEPIHISEMPLDNSYEDAELRNEHPIIQNIRFSNIQINSEAGILLYAFHPNSIRNITFDGIDMQISNGKFQQYSGGNFDLRPSKDHELSVFAHDIPAFYLKGTKDISIKNYSLKWLDEMPDYYTNAIYGEDLDGLLIDDVQLSVPPETDHPEIYLKNGSNLTLDEKQQSVQKENIQ